ncbi:hypothetical protein GN956_G10086 [Arapaima gigas]
MKDVEKETHRERGRSNQALKVSLRHYEDGTFCWRLVKQTLWIKVQKLCISQQEKVEATDMNKKTFTLHRMPQWNIKKKTCTQHVRFHRSPSVRPQMLWKKPSPVAVEEDRRD